MDWNKEYNSYRYYCVGFLLPSSKLQFQCEFIRDLNEKINILIHRYFTSEFLIMGDFNCGIGKRKVHKPRLFDVRKQCNSEDCNSAENQSSKGKPCKTEQNKYRDNCEINNFEILNGKFLSYTRREFTFINNSELG